MILKGKMKFELYRYLNNTSFNFKSFWGNKNASLSFFHIDIKYLVIL